MRLYFLLSVYFTTIDIGNPPNCISAIHMNSGTVYNIFEDTIRHLATPVIYTFLRRIFRNWIVTAFAGKTYFRPVLPGRSGFFLLFER